KGSVGPIPSGRIPGQWGLIIALIGTGLSAAVALALGWWTFVAALIGLVLAWAYSAPPLRLKLNGWTGNAAVAICYEGLPWFTGAAIMAQAFPDPRVVLIAFLYSVGAHGIMVLNDFKAIDGDTRLGVRSLPVQLGADRAAKLACWVMGLAQLAVIILLSWWGQTLAATIITASLALQVLCMRRLLADPKGQAPWYNATGTSLYVLGMLAAAFALRAMAS
ncbi:MAG: (bacterio)chlorophyll synthase, partial [Pseudomonadota bacterium]